MRFCISAILVSLTSKGASTGAADGVVLAGVGGFLPPVSHMMTTMENPSPMRNHDWTFFGRTPLGFCVFSWTSAGCFGWLIALPSVPDHTPRKRQFLLTDNQVAGVDDFRCDVAAVFELERDQVRLAVLDFIERGLFSRAALDVGERVVVVDGGDQEWDAARFPVERVVELEFRGVAGPETVQLFGGLHLRRADLIRGLGAERFEFLLVRLGLARADIAAQPRVRRATGATILQFHEELEIGLSIRLVADFGQQERVDVAARGDEVQIAADAGLGRMDVTKVVRTVDDPEFLVTRGEIQDLLVLGQDDERREPELGVDLDNVFLRILHDARCCIRRGVRRRGSYAGEAEENETTHKRL